MKYYLILVLSLIMPITSWSKDFGPDYIGRLFTTQEQRQEIDNRRYSKKVVVEQKTSEVNINDQDSKSPSLDSLYFKGVIRSENGNRVLWINNNNSMEADFINEDIKISNHSDFSRVRILLPNGDIIPLQVGDKVELHNKKDN